MALTKIEREAKLRRRLADMKQYENDLYDNKWVRYVIGVDEVGRGPLAGPVCAAAVVLPRDFDVLGVDDSKKVSAKKREILYGEITGRALAWGVGLVENPRIDEINILNATKEAMAIAVGEAAGKLPDGETRHLLVDALSLDTCGIPCTPLVKGDSLSVSIAAASIVAKVTRDRIMVRYDEVYPGYSFATNKGYGTKAHYEGIARLGITPIHRRTFVGS
jgi:ribonuclease HII